MLKAKILESKIIELKVFGNKETKGPKQDSQNRLRLHMRGEP